MAPPHSSQRTCLTPQLSEEFSLSSMPSTHLSQRLQYKDASFSELSIAILKFNLRIGLTVPAAEAKQLSLV